MFDIGFLELIVIGVVALIVVGPERLPRLARTAGLWLGRARRTLATVKAEIDSELKAEELKEILAKQARENPLETLIEMPAGQSQTKSTATTGIRGDKPSAPTDKAS
jgi:sec-independent protein translocase protein TatB